MQCPRVDRTLHAPMHQDSSQMLPHVTNVLVSYFTSPSLPLANQNSLKSSKTAKPRGRSESWRQSRCAGRSKTASSPAIWSVSNITSWPINRERPKPKCELSAETEYSALSKCGIFCRNWIFCRIPNILQFALYKVYFAPQLLLYISDD